MNWKCTDCEYAKDFTAIGFIECIHPEIKRKNNGGLVFEGKTHPRWCPLVEKHMQKNKHDKSLPGTDIDVSENNEQNCEKAKREVLQTIAWVLENAAEQEDGSFKTSFSIKDVKNQHYLLCIRREKNRIMEYSVSLDNREIRLINQINACNDEIHMIINREAMEIYRKNIHITI